MKRRMNHIAQSARTALESFSATELKPPRTTICLARSYEATQWLLPDCLKPVRFERDRRYPVVLNESRERKLESQFIREFAGSDHIAGLSQRECGENLRPGPGPAFR